MRRSTALMVGLALLALGGCDWRDTYVMLDRDHAGTIVITMAGPFARKAAETAAMELAEKTCADHAGRPPRVASTVNTRGPIRSRSEIVFDCEPV